MSVVQQGGDDIFKETYKQYTLRDYKHESKITATSLDEAKKEFKMRHYGSTAGWTNVQHISTK